MDPSVFSNTKVILSQQFVDKIPTHINMIKFLEGSVNSLNCVVSYESDSPIYSLEGFWDEIVSAQSVLIDKYKSFTHRPTDEAPAKVMGGQSVDQEQCESQGIIEIDLDCSQTSETSTKSEEQLCAQENEVIVDSKIKERCPSKGTVDSTVNENENSRSTLEYDSQIMDTSTVNELCVDIQLEHNYNNFRTVGINETCSETADSAIENEIYMDIKLSNPTDKIFSDPDMPVTLVVAKEDEPGVEVVQLNVKKCDSVAQGIKKAKFSAHTQEQARLKRRKYEENTPYKYFCSHCSFKTKRHSHMRKHTRLHEKVCTIYSCEQCNFSTIRASHLQRHIGTHQSEVFACSECTFSTHSEALLTKHQRYKHVLKKTEETKITNIYQCLHCDYSTASEKIFERHLSVHSKKGSLKRLIFKCSKCAYQTPSRPNYLRHLLIHGDERPFMCSTCGLCFKRSDTLAQHQVVHSELEQGQSVFSCPQCKKCYRSASALKDHQFTHEQERHYLCEICAASFKTRAVQRKHYNEKHVHEKVHSCPSCSKSFISKYLLKRHMKVHAPNATRAEETESQQTSTDPSLWCNSLVPIQTPTEDVQVIVVHQEPSESEVSIQDGPLFQIASSLVPGQTLSVPIIPVEYVVSAADAKTDSGSLETAVGGPNRATNISSREAELIALTLVPDGAI